MKTPLEFMDAVKAQCGPVTDFYAFASDSPMLTFFLVLVAGELLVKAVRQAFRSITIWIHGYPPMWCDVDGDFPKAKKSEDE